MTVRRSSFIDLIVAARAGDHEAFSQLLLDCEDRAYRQALAILRDPHYAADATQEALLAAFVGLASLRDPAALPQWLNGIVRHQCHRILRRRDLEWISLDAEIERSYSEAPHDRAAGDELLSRVHEAIRALPKELRTVVELYYLKGCTQHEAAAFLSLPVTTVNNRLSAARRALRERISAMTQPSIAPPASSHAISNIGTIIGVEPPVITVRFDQGPPPDIFDALAVCDGDAKLSERMKVAQRLDNGIVRCLTTCADGDLKPGMNILNTRSVGLGLTPYVGVSTTGVQQLNACIQKLAPTPPTTPNRLETGIKPLDLFCPLTFGGNFGLFGIQGVGRIVLVEELLRRLSTSAQLNLFYLVHRNEPDSVRDMLTKEKGYPGDATGGVNIFWILNDIATDRDVAAQNGSFDASAFCTPLLGAQGLFPAIDPLAARSRLIEEKHIDPAHASLLARLRDVLHRAKELMSDPIMLEHIACRAVAKARERAATFAPQRLSELDHADRQLVSRARKIERFLTTPFFVAEPFTRLHGHFVPLTQTIAGCNAILDGAYDDVAEESFLYIGEVTEARNPRRGYAA